MLGRLASTLLPPALRLGGASRSAFRAVADVEINLNDRETLKKYVGVRDHLSKDPGTKGKFIVALQEVLEAVKVLPDVSDYRKAVEATAQYKLKVCEANDSDAAVEEVLDSHLEELIQECKEEIKLIPLLADHKPWDVPASYAVPVFDYMDASTILNAPKK